MGIETIEVQTFESIGVPKVLYMNSTNESDIILWKSIIYNHAEHIGYGQCFTLVISKVF